MAQFIKGTVPAQVAKWFPKKTKEAEKRALVNIEIPCTEEVLNELPVKIRKAAVYVAKVDHEVSASRIPREYDGQTIEFYATPDSAKPILVLVNATVRKLEVSRDDNATGADMEAVLFFSVNTGTSDAEMVSLLNQMWGTTVFLQFHEVQGVIFDQQTGEPADVQAV